MERPGDRNEVGHQVERHRQVGDEHPEQQLASPWHAPVGQQLPHENHAVGDKPAQGENRLIPGLRTRLGAPAEVCGPDDEGSAAEAHGLPETSHYDD
jgi:hypothetical protein